MTELIRERTGANLNSTSAGADLSNLNNKDVTSGRGAVFGACGYSLILDVDSTLS